MPSVPPACPFCSLSDEPVFHEGVLVRGLWDAFPVNPGHALLIPRRHVASWFEATRAEQAELLEAVEVARAEIDRRFGADGFNLGINVGAAAGQTISHLHLHVIPRRTGDVPDPRGGVRHVIPERGNYLPGADGAQLVRDRARWRDGHGLAGADQRALVTGADDPLLLHLVDHLDRATRSDLVVAFVLESGVAEIEEALRNFLVRGGRLRILTGDYLDATDPRALRRLLDLRSYVAVGGADATPEGGRLELRVFESAGGSFHPKAYLFRFDGPPRMPSKGIAYVGSSNLSRTALREGVEWNYRIVTARDRDGFEDVAHEFDRLFVDPRTRELDEGWIEGYERRRRTVQQAVPEIVAERPQRGAARG